MRTVVFSNEAVVKLVNDRFISSWHNKSPKTKFRDGVWSRLDKRTYETYALGNGVTNITAIFALPDGTVLNAVPGYLDVKAFEAEATFAIDLAARIADGKGRLCDGAERMLAEAHREQAGVRRGPYARKAHARLADAGKMMMDAIGPTYFNDLQERRDG
jgi:hypothetical protein